MLIYIIKSTACLAILFFFYKLFLERENMHVFKRFYLLGSLVFALIVPTIVFSEYVMIEPQVYETPQHAALIVSRPNIPPALEADVTDIAPLLWIVYFLGLFFFGIKFLRNLFQIFGRIRRNPKYKISSFVHVLLQEKIPPHTFFKYIFLNRSKFESKEIPKEVLLHEETHARQKHSFDVVFIELLQVIFWVNPLIYFFKKAIKLNHEFLADSAVLNNDVDAVTYQNTLLSFLSSENEKKYRPALPNAINYSSIKKRFTIMKSKTSRKSVFFRSILLLPLLALLVVGFSETRILPKEAMFDIPIQEGATSEQMEEYNALAKKYNAMLQQDDIRIEMSDVERMEYLYSLMTEKQREEAESFPDFPEPPPPPEAPQAPEEMEEEIIEMEHEMEKQALVMEEHRIEMEKEAAAIEEQTVEMERSAVVEEERAIELEKHAKAMKVERSEMERQAKIMEEHEIEMEKKARKKDRALITAPKPPPRPPSSKSPLEHIEEMKGQGATFYHGKKKISFKKAVDILKKNSDLSIDIKQKNNDPPIVKISKYLD